MERADRKVADFDWHLRREVRKANHRRFSRELFRWHVPSVNHSNCYHSALRCPTQVPPRKVKQSNFVRLVQLSSNTLET